MEVVVDILQVLEGLAYVGFIAGAIFAVLELRGIGRDRRVNLVVDMQSKFLDADMTDAWSKVMTGTFQNAEDMERKCSYSSLTKIAALYESIGYLVRKRLVDPEIVLDLMPVSVAYNRMAPWLVYERERSGEPTAWEEFEYLAKLNDARKG